MSVENNHRSDNDDVEASLLLYLKDHLVLVGEPELSDSKSDIPKFPPYAEFTDAVKKIDDIAEDES